MTPGDLRAPPAVSPDGRWRPGWFIALAAVGGVLFTAGLVVEVRCAVGRCPTPVVRRLFELDGLGSLPRMFTTAVFVLVAVLAGFAGRRTSGRARVWWALMVAGALGLAGAKAVSVHSALEQDDGRLLTLVGGVAVTVAALPLLWWIGRRSTVLGVVPVVAALAGYAGAALGLDLVTAAVGALSRSAALGVLAVYVEEGGEAVAALVVLAAVARAGARNR